MRKYLQLKEDILKVGFNIAKLAHTYGFSVRQFERLFMQEFQCTPKAFAKKIRMDLAVSRLKSHARLKEIAAELGYKHQADFSRAFKAHYGTTPKELQFKMAKKTGNRKPLSHFAYRKSRNAK